jgi:c-di-GMP-binding flagellar brake protein YcgR
MTPLAINDSVRIAFVPSTGSGEAAQVVEHPYVATVTQTREAMFLVTFSLANKVSEAVGAGVRISLIKSVSGRALIYRAVVKAVVLKRPLILHLTTPTQYVEIQRRAHFRLGIEMQIRCSTPSGDQEWHSAALRDISEGGACLIDTEPRAVKEELLLELPLETGVVQVKGVVRRCSPSGPGHVLGVQFSEVAPADQAKVMKFIFTQQLKRFKG